MFSVLDKTSVKSQYIKAISDELFYSLDIENEKIDYESIVSSVSKTLGVDLKVKDRSNSYSDGLARAAFDALNDHSPLTKERLFSWHRLLGVAGAFRTRPEYVIKAKGQEVEVLYEAVPADTVEEQMERLLDYINNAEEDNPIVKSSIAALNFVVIHPFADGNGRISRLISWYLMAKAYEESIRVFSQSALIRKYRDDYYSLLESVTGQSQSLEITEWLSWNIDIAEKAQLQAINTIRKTLRINAFIGSLDPNEYNSRELNMLYRLASENFYGKLSKEKWMKLTKCSAAAAFRDMSHLVEKGYLIPNGEQGPKTGYYLNPELE